jgi:hypothetical protein
MDNRLGSVLAWVQLNDRTRSPQFPDEPIPSLCVDRKGQIIGGTIPVLAS